MTEERSPEHYSTRFENCDGELLGDMPGLLAITLCKGMQITIHGQNRKFRVAEWRFHHGHPDEDAGLTIVLE
jgi:hypothetical protein